jgi:TonB family protein
MRFNTALFLAGVALVNMKAAPTQVPDGPDSFFDLMDVDVRPKAIAQTAPVYPINQSNAGLTGAVRINFLIDAAGRVRNPYVVESNNPAFERPALDAISEWRFKPGEKNGHAVTVRAEQVIEFRMNRGGEAPWQVTKPRNQSNLPLALQWDVAPVPISTTFPVYPYEALYSGVKGKTRVRFVIGPDGSITESKLDMATTPELGLAALAMIDTWKFKPAEKKDGTLSYATLAMEHEFLPSGRGTVPINPSARNILYQVDNHPEKIFKGGQLDQTPKRLAGRPAAYPTALRNSGKKGEATIEFFIDENGDAQLPRIVSSSAPEFGYAAAQAVVTWRFSPPMKDGKPVISRAQGLVDFDPASLRPPPPPTPRS